MFNVINIRIRSPLLLMLILVCAIIFSTTILLVPQTIDEPNVLNQPFGIVISEARESSKEFRSEDPRFLNRNQDYKLRNKNSDENKQRNHNNRTRIRSLTVRSSVSGGDTGLDEGKLAKLLSERFNLNYGAENCTSGSSGAGGDCDRKESSLVADKTKPREQQQDSRPELPRPRDLTVQILSWYPPILAVNWSLNELKGAGEFGKLNYYEINNFTTKSGNKIDSDKLVGDFDLDQAIEDYHQHHNEGNSMVASSSVEQLAVQAQQTGAPTMSSDNFGEFLKELKIRRFLIRKSLSCFQVIYNVVNSR